MTPRPGRRGSAALEFALTLPILVGLTWGAVELSHAIEEGQAMADAARVGALAGARAQESLPATGSVITATAEAAATAALLDMGLSCGAGCTVDATFGTLSGWEAVTVTITRTYADLTGASWVPGTLSRSFTELTIVQNP